MTASTFSTWDADHSYEGTCRDLAAIQAKIREQGWLVLNDYAPEFHRFPRNALWRYSGLPRVHGQE